ncbi:lipid carrier : UDP-N-acetylgalactosaminyltransferase [Blastochloris viridis]|nr:lipid carrier : UDP-N-acetylgalactosaminyltransferase [Blastochloris viridis]
MNSTGTTAYVALVGPHAGMTINFRGPLIDDLVGIGSKVAVLAPDFTDETRGAIAAMGAAAHDYPLARTGLNPLADLGALYALWRWFRRERPAVAFTFAAKAVVWGTLAAAAAGVPNRVAMIEGLGYAFIPSSGLKQRVVRWVLVQLYRLAFRLAHTVVVLNPDDARDLSRWCNLKADKTVLLGGIGVALDEWRPPSRRPGSPITFTMMSRILREKGVFEFLKAAEQVKARHPEVRFWLLGSVDCNPGGIQPDDLQPWVESGIVTWPGQVDVKPYLAETSVFVLPSFYREGVPRSTQEAMAMGCAVITTDAPGCRDTVAEGVNGFMVPIQDVDALVAAMERFIAQPDLIEQMGRESRRLAEQRFDATRANRRLIEVMFKTDPVHAPGETVPG